MKLTSHSPKNKTGLLLVILVLVSIFTLPAILNKFYLTNQIPPPRAGGGGAKLCLQNCTNTAVNTPISQPFSLPIILDSDQASVSKVELVVHYDNVLMKLIDMNPVAKDTTNLKLFSPYDAFGNFQKDQVMIDANNSGVLHISVEAADWNGSANRIAPFVGNTNLVILTFQPQAYGKTSIYFEKGQDGKDKSMIVRSGDSTDILTQTSDLQISVTIDGASIKVPNSMPTSTSADINNDGKVNSSDVDSVSSDFGKTGSPGFSKEDVNQDGKVDIFDRNIIINQAEK